MIITANIIPTKKPTWALRLLMNLPFDRDVVYPDDRFEEMKSKILSYLQSFEYPAQMHRNFWNEHELNIMDRVFTIQTMEGTPLLYVMLSEDKPQKGTCAVCGCSEDNACVHVDVGPCWWMDNKKILCSHCALNFDLRVNEGVW